MKGPRKSTEWRGVVRATRRLVEVRRQNDTLLAAYRYNGLNQRITWHYDADEDGDTDGSDPVYHFCYDDKWRIVGTWRGADTDPKEAFTYHNAGLAGRGGSSYIDTVVLRDRDTNGGGGWTGASDGSLNARHYYAQNWRADVSGIFDHTGAVLEWVKYSAYGVPHLLTPGDHDKSGEVDKDDETAFNADYGTGNLRADLDEDGDVDTDDQTLFTASFNKTTPGGRWKLSAADVGNRKGYAGYEHEGFGNDLAAPEIAHVRNRVLHFGLGRWTRRDPLGYVGGENLLSYCDSNPSSHVDSFGLVAGSAGGSGGGGLSSGCVSGGSFVGDSKGTQPGGSRPPITLTWDQRALMCSFGEQWGVVIAPNGRKSVYTCSNPSIRPSPLVPLQDVPFAPLRATYPHLICEQIAGSQSCIAACEGTRDDTIEFFRELKSLCIQVANVQFAVCMDACGGPTYRFGTSTPCDLLFLGCSAIQASQYAVCFAAGLGQYGPWPYYLACLAACHEENQYVCFNCTSCPPGYRQIASSPGRPGAYPKTH